MMRIEVRQLGAQPPAEPIFAEFDEMGGSIGRSEGNTLMLPDEKRYISRTQAAIAYRAGSYLLRDLGSATPTLVNGNAVGNGNEVALKGGDEIRIGDYVLAVSGAPAAAELAGDPFADLLPPAAPKAAVPERHAAPARVVQPFDDPFASPPAPAKAPASQHGGIPQDFDPFADLVPAPGAPAQPHADLNLGSAPDQSLDALFGLKGGGDWDPLASSGSLSEAPAAGAAGLDPLAAFAPEAEPPRAPAQRDDAAMLSASFRLPRPQHPAPEQPRAAPPAEPEVQPSPTLPDDVFLSWDEPPAAASGGPIKSVVLPSPKPAPAAEVDSAPPQPVQPAHVPSHAAVAAAPAKPAPSRDELDALLEAFLSGAGMPKLDIPGGMTPELMTLVGTIMREAVRGTLDLLVARAITKREVRAQATVIVARENNPLKFSPSVEAALTHLLGPQGHGFRAPAAAVRDAYNDLRSHQLGFMAGMRAALEGVLARFDPAQLEQRITQKSGMFGGASARKAKLWELYEQRYRDISREAEDDFHTLFGREFLRAYEAQIEKLEQEDAADPR